MNYFINVNILESHFLLDFLGYLSIISGILVITAKNPIVSILYLIALFINVAIYLEVYGLNLIGLIYILVYVGAIAILLLFIIMLLNIKISELNDADSNAGEDIPLSTLISLAYIYFWFSFSKNTYEGVIGKNSNDLLINLKSTIDEILFPVKLDSEYFVNMTNNDNIYNLDSIIHDKVSLGTIKELNTIGELFYTEYGLNFIIISLVLLLSIITAIVVTRNSKIIKE